MRFVDNEEMESVFQGTASQSSDQLASKMEELRDQQVYSNGVCYLHAGMETSK